MIKRYLGTMYTETDISRKLSAGVEAKHHLSFLTHTVGIAQYIPTVPVI